MEENKHVADLRTQISKLESHLSDLKQQLARAEKSTHVKVPSNLYQDLNHSNSDDSISSSRNWPLDQEEYRRYGRQMILPEIGLQGEHHKSD